MTAKIFRNAFLIGFTVLLACILLFFFIMYSNYQAQAFDNLAIEAEHISEGMQICGGESYLSAVQSGERITWIAADGSVLYDNMADSSTMENHLQRPEVAEAFETGSGRSDRYSSTILEKNNYYALLLKDGTVLRVAGKQTSLAAMALMLVQPSMWIVVLYPELQPLITRLQEQNRTIRTQLSELSTRQREFDAITENMREGFLIVDNKCSILSSNRSALRLLGIDDAQKPENLHQAVCSGKLLDLVDNALAGTRGDEEITVGGGTWQLFANPVITAGHVTGAIIIFMDVTEREQREALRREFSANVSHELKTPLTSIVNYVDLLEKEDIQPEKAKEYVDVLHRQSARLKKLTEDLVEASKASSGCLPVHLARTDVNVLLSQLAGDYLEKLEAAQLEPVFHPAPSQPKIQADGQLLSRVLGNLFSNICKYAMPGTRVYFESSAAGGIVTITFKNISKYELNIPAEELMARFVRGDRSRHTEGSGLGLSIAQSLTELQGGSFRLEIDGDLFKAIVSFPQDGTQELHA